MSAPRTTTAAAILGLGGALVFVGGQMHPHEAEDTVDETLAAYFTSPVWTLSHLLILAGLVVAVVGLVLARRADLLGRSARPWVTATAVAWAVGSIEMLPHILADRDLEHLQHGGPTPILDLHLVLGAFASPLIGFSAAALAVVVARSARTWPARLLAVPGVLGGVAYGLAGPVILLTDDVTLSPLFAGQALVALWVMGTAVRLGVGAGTTVDASDGPVPLGVDPAVVR